MSPEEELESREGETELVDTDSDAVSRERLEVEEIEEGDADDGYEVIELELDEEDIVRYLEDDDGNRIGFVLIEDGDESEYFYVEDDVDDDEEDNEFDLGITTEGVAQATSDVNAIYRDGVAVANELKGAFDDIKSAFDFGAFAKKK